tara:strand:- start:836 stop:1741 length:906 start_codon:yes stop_codon:yes gene_type:complete
MKAIIQKKYGGVDKLTLKEVEKPTISKNQMLIKVYAANVSSGDMRLNTLDVPLLLIPMVKLIFGFKGPRNQTRGISGSGVVSEIGSNIKEYKVGDKIYFINTIKAGCLAEYVVLNNKSIISKIPDNLSFNESAPLAFGAMSALHFINESTIQKGDQVLVYGASGSVGSYAIQLSKYYGATVTAVCSKKNHKIMQQIGADYVIDYHKTDFTKGNKKYDFVFDTVMKTAKKDVKKILFTNGKYKTTKSPSSEKIERLKKINQIIKEGKLITVIDKVYKLQNYKEAHEHVYSKHKIGNVIVEIA